MSDAAVSAAVFDLGGVVIEISRSRTVRAWAEATGLAPEEVCRRLADPTLYRRFERGELGPDEFYARTQEALGAAIARNDFLRGWAALLGGPLPGIAALLADLKTRLRIVALTNTNVLHTRLWERTCADAVRHFERVFTSHDLGCRKPEPAAFRPVLEYLGLPAARVAYFDDMEENVTAAAALGLVARQAAGAEDVRRHLASLGIPGGAP